MTIDTRVPEMILLLHVGRIDDACELMEAFCEEVGKPRPVWCPSDARRTATDAAQHVPEHGVAV